MPLDSRRRKQRLGDVCDEAGGHPVAVEIGVVLGDFQCGTGRIASEARKRVMEIGGADAAGHGRADGGSVARVNGVEIEGDAKACRAVTSDRQRLRHDFRQSPAPYFEHREHPDAQAVEQGGFRRLEAAHADEADAPGIEGG